MRIVTIARETGAITLEQETALCHALGLRFVHRGSLEEHFDRLGTDARFLQRFDERKPRLVDSFLNRPDVYWETLKTAILQEAVRGDVAIIGRGANFFLGNLTKCLRLRFVAPLEVRAERIARQQNCSREQALNFIRKNDRERIGFCYYFYGTKWRDVNSYDLTLNTAEVEVSALEGTIRALSEAKTLSGSDGHVLQNLMLSQNIRYKLTVTEKIYIRFLEITCDDGHITVDGVVSSRGAAERAEKVIRQVEGVRGVENRIAVIQNEIPMRLE